MWNDGFTTARWSKFTHRNSLTNIRGYRKLIAHWSLSFDEFARQQMHNGFKYFFEEHLVPEKCGCGCIALQVLQVPFCEEKSVQLVRVASFRSDFLQNPYFSTASTCAIFSFLHLCDWFMRWLSHYNLPTNKYFIKVAFSKN